MTSIEIAAAIKAGTFVFPIVFASEDDFIAGSIIGTGHKGGDYSLLINILIALAGSNNAVEQMIISIDESGNISGL